MNQPTPDRSVLDTPIEEDFEADELLATHLRTLSRVSHATAHDIRTPLHTVILYLELLRNTLAEEPSPDQTTRQGRYVDVIRGELLRLEDMLEKLLVQTRVSEGKIERFDLVESLGEWIAFLDPQRRRTRIELGWTPPTRPVMVEGERDPIRHALVYLLATAIDATPEGDRLSVDLAARDGRAVITISGTGVTGWTDALVDGFREGGEVSSADVEGGVRASSRAVARHRGTIKVRPGASGAATLEIQLPLLAAEDG